LGGGAATATRVKNATAPQPTQRRARPIALIAATTTTAAAFATSGARRRSIPHRTALKKDAVERDDPKEHKPNLEHDGLRFAA
jgi:hypothetical protein